MIDLAFVSYTAVMSITPGPNNLMLAASGVNHGFRRTVPHILGISTGVSLMLLGMATLTSFATGWFGAIRGFLALAGCLYLLWLSWHIFRSGRPEGRQSAKPLGFWGAFAFQALNPKCWVMAINAALIFTPAGDARLLGSLGMAGVFAVVNLACVSVWAITGDRLRHLLGRPRPLSIFNAVMGGLMAATALWLLADEFLALLPKA
jgi:threonine/homoserine/homoserine lactone efflux protein